jgi:ribosomal protein L31
MKKGKTPGHTAQYDAHNYVEDFEKRFKKKKKIIKVK